MPHIMQMNWIGIQLTFSKLKMESFSFIQKMKSINSNPDREQMKSKLSAEIIESPEKQLKMYRIEKFEDGLGYLSLTLWRRRLPPFLIFHVPFLSACFLF